MLANRSMKMTFGRALRCTRGPVARFTQAEEQLASLMDEPLMPSMQQQEIKSSKEAVVVVDALSEPLARFTEAEEQWERLVEAPLMSVVQARKSPSQWEQGKVPVVVGVGGMLNKVGMHTGETSRKPEPLAEAASFSEKPKTEEVLASLISKHHLGSRSGNVARARRNRRNANVEVADGEMQCSKDEELLGERFFDEPQVDKLMAERKEWWLAREASLLEATWCNFTPRIRALAIIKYEQPAVRMRVAAAQFDEWTLDSVTEPDCEVFREEDLEASRYEVRASAYRARRLIQVALDAHPFTRWLPIIWEE